MWNTGKDLIQSRADRLYTHHALFYALWDMGQIVFSEQIPTACITFDKETGAELNFMFNPDFWDSLSETQRDFVICHEMLHITYGHGRRMFTLSTGDTQLDALKKNYAADIVVNESLVRSFGFIREEVDPEGMFCWRDTVFKDVKEHIKDEETYEYYLNKINENQDQCLKNQNLKLVDVHQAMEGQGDGKGEDQDGQMGKQVEELTPDMIEKLKEKMSDHQIDDLDEGMQKHNQGQVAKQAGHGHYGKWVFANVRPIKPNRMFEKLLKRRIRALDEYKDEEDWRKRNRRMLTFESPEVFLPGQDEVPVKGAIDIVLFLDCSGSCAELRTKFLRVARSIDKTRFRPRAAVFDTRVKEFNPWKEDKIMLGGGTAFDILEEWIQKNYNGYPDAVFVMTDGYGNMVEPEKPERWHWFLSEDYTHCFPKISKRYMLDDIDPKWRTYD